MTKETFKKALENKNIMVTKKMLDQFEKYMQLLLEWNQKMNLTAITIEEEIWEKHFYDSIVPFENLSHKTLCDVGSGAGFPGIPLKIVFPDMELTIVEPLQKRCRFLETVKEALDLKGVNIYPERAEDFWASNNSSCPCFPFKAIKCPFIFTKGAHNSTK